ncbi:MAG: methyltransferase domain-containing protein [Chloroflexi bacterium]|nr:methyltransferase domain-containing protein [Chloroflexota bacterium]
MTQTETRSPHFGREATAATYRDIHLPRVFAPWARILLEIVPPRPGDAVLDVATGPGTVARPAAAKAGPSGRVTGVDLSAAMLGVARSFPPEPQSAPIEYLESPATSIPLPDASFDRAYCQQGLQHMSDPGAALREIRRLLKPGSRLAVAIWQQSPFSLFRQVVADLGIAAEGAQPSTFGRDPGELTRALKQAGFTEVEVQTRQLESVLEGGIPQALEVAVATSAGAGMGNLSSADQERVRAALSRALQPLVKPDGVHLISISSIASATCA